jgi:shikimate kinase
MKGNSRGDRPEKLVVIGFMGSGKSSVAELLATRCGLRCVEMDSLIVKRTGHPSVAELIDALGEQAFRTAEEFVARDLRNAQGVVISTGGGVVQNPRCMEPLTHGASSVIYLRTRFDTLEQRVLTQLDPTKERPLFRDKEKARLLYQTRMPLYERWSTRTIDTDDRTVEEIAEEILS